MPGMLLGSDGAVRDLPDGFTFADAQKFVGGYVERVSLPITLFGPPGPACLLVNEDGRMIGLPRNARASALVGMDIVGPVVLLRDSSVAAVLGGG